MAAKFGAMFVPKSYGKQQEHAIAILAEFHKQADAMMAQVKVVNDRISAEGMSIGKKITVALNKKDPFLARQFCDIKIKTVTAQIEKDAKAFAETCRQVRALPFSSNDTAEKMLQLHAFILATIEKMEKNPMGVFDLAQKAVLKTLIQDRTKVVADACVPPQPVAVAAAKPPVPPGA